MTHRPITRLLVAAATAGTLALSACGTEDSGSGSSASTTGEQSSDAGGHGEHGESREGGDQGSEESGHSGMSHPTDGGPVPSGMTEADDPEYAVGSKVTLTAGHMEGMKGAEATVVGAYDTTTYSVTYTPTTGGEPVEDHKWVVQEELEGTPDEPAAKGDEVTLTAEHMEGMKGAEATVDSSTDETVYVVDYEMDGMTMKNHKWVVESEMEPAS